MFSLVSFWWIYWWRHNNVEHPPLLPFALALWRGLPWSWLMADSSNKNAHAAEVEMAAFIGSESKSSDDFLVQEDIVMVGPDRPTVTSSILVCPFKAPLPFAVLAICFGTCIMSFSVSWAVCISASLNYCLIGSLTWPRQNLYAISSEVWTLEKSWEVLAAIFTY